ncbi:MAG: hypothetical protein ACPIOQ_24645 [Promethearchaeia archaeon]
MRIRAPPAIARIEVMRIRVKGIARMAASDRNDKVRWSAGRAQARVSDIL